MRTRDRWLLRRHTKDPRWRGAQQAKGSIFGSGGVTLFGGEEEGAAAVGIGVNAFLWRATLDTISFMPLLSADPFGGVIITDWYAPPETPDERFKMTVYILTRTLRSDGVQVSVFRQGRGDDGLWEGTRDQPRHRRQPGRQDSRPRQADTHRVAPVIEGSAPSGRRRSAAALYRLSCYRDAALRRRPEYGSERDR